MKLLNLDSVKKQKLLILLCCLVYSFAYAGRYSYSANIGSIIDFYGITRAEAGVVSTFFFFSYGVGQLLNAFLCKFYPKRYVISGALWISAGINLILFFLPSFGLIKYLWLLNGICQSVLWPSLTLTIGEWVDRSLTKRAVFAMSMSVVIGTLIAYGGSSLFNLIGHFRLSFLLGVAFPAAIGVIWVLSYGVLTGEKSVSEAAEQPSEEKQKAPVSNRSVVRALTGLLIVCALFAVVDNFVKDGLNTWTPVILKEQFGFKDGISIVLTLVLPIFGVFGSVIALQANKVLKDFRSLIGAFYLVLSICLLGVIWALKVDSVVATLILFGLISCLSHGINNVLVSIMPLHLRDRINTGFLAGLMNSACYIGSTASAYGLGKLADGKGWNFVICVLLTSTVAATVLAGVVTLRLAASNQRRKNEE